MEGLLSVPSAAASPVPTAYSARADLDASILASIGTPGKSDKVSLDFGELYKGLSIGSKTIVDKLNELLEAKLPNGIQSLKPEEVTPEATAERIVRGATGFFDVFSKQNADLEGEELLNKFMETIRGGIEKGYGEAFDTLEGLGAFDVDGVQSGVEETKKLIEEKLEVFEREMRKKLGIDPVDVEAETASITKTTITAAAGARTLSITA